MMVARANSDGYPWTSLKIWKMGLLGITIPESKGGIGGSLTDAILAIQAVAEFVRAVLMLFRRKFWRHSDFC